MTKQTLNQQAPIFWKGRLCKKIEWDIPYLQGKVKVKLTHAFFTVDINELTN